MSEKREILDIISNITAIPGSLLRDETNPADFSVAERMSWASNRTTTRIEDEAYSLMGLFNVSMPLLYGEKGNAFRRLQEEIMKRTNDQSIFSWTLPEGEKLSLTGFLAQSPKSFVNSHGIKSMGIWGGGDLLGLTNRGIRAKIYLLPIGKDKVTFDAALDCWSNSDRDRVVKIGFIVLRMAGTSFDWNNETHFLRHHLGSQLVTAKKEDLVGGEYRDICVADLTSTPNMLGLGAYDSRTKYVRIQHPGRPFSVQPVGSWEPQTGVFTDQHDVAGPLGAVCVPSDGCVYIVYFGKDIKGDFWVVADFETTEIDLDYGDIWMRRMETGKETTKSEVSYRPSKQPNSYEERLVVLTEMIVRCGLVFDCSQSCH